MDRQKLPHEVGGVYHRYETQTDGELVQELLGSLFGAIAFAGFIVMLAVFI
jgi:hypothetical protein